MHKKHQCQFCQTYFHDSDHSIANPIAELFNPENVKNSNFAKKVKFVDELDLKQRDMDISIQNCESVVASPIELVNFRTFYSGAKKSQYESTFSMLVSDVTFQEQLNFTHRASHGELGAGDVHGDLADVSKQFLEVLKVDFPSVFDEPIYPV